MCVCACVRACVHLCACVPACVCVVVVIMCFALLLYIFSKYCCFFHTFYQVFTGFRLFLYFRFYFYLFLKETVYTKLTFAICVIHLYYIGLH